MLPHRRRADLAAALFLLAFAGAAPGCKGSRQAGVGGPGDGAADRGGGDLTGGGNPDAGRGPDGTGSDGGPGADAAADIGRPADTGAAAGDATAGDTPGSDAAPADGGFGAGCNTLVPGTPVTVVCAGDGGVTSNPGGGSIGAGTYVLTSITVFGPCIVLDVAQTLVVSGATIQTAIQDSITGLSRGNSTFAVSGAGVFSQLTQTNTCPDTTTRAFGYTATGNTLTLYSTDSGTTTVGVLTRQ